MKGLSLAGHEEVSHGFGLRTGDGSETADDAVDFCFFLLEDSTSDWHVLRLVSLGTGGKAGLCVFVGTLK